MDDFAEIGRIVAFQLVRNRDKSLALANLIPQEMVPDLQQALNMNVEDIPTRFRFKVHTTDVDKTEMAKKQNLLMVTQLYNQLGEKTFQLLPLVYNPQVPQEIKLVAAKYFAGSVRLMEDVFKFFGEEDTTKYLPYIQNIEMILEYFEAQQDQTVKAVKSQQGGEGGEATPGAGAIPGSTEARPGPGGPGPAGPGGGGPSVATPETT